MERKQKRTKKNHNGIKRLVFSALAILLQIIFIICLFTRLNRYAAAINMVTSILVFILVLSIYGKEQAYEKQYRNKLLELEQKLAG